MSTKTLWERIRLTMPNYREPEQKEAFKPRRERRKPRRDIEKEVAETIRFERSDVPPTK